MEVLLHTEYVKRGLAMSVPGAYWEDGWRATITTERAAAIALALFPEILSVYPKLGEMRDALYGDARPTDFATPADIRLSWEGTGLEPFEYQAIDSGFLHAQVQRLGGGFLGWDRGLGKTAATIAMCRELDAKRVLAVCGNTMKATVWGKELAACWPEAHVRVIPNEKRKREAWLDERARKQRTILSDGTEVPTVCIVHYEALALIAGDKGRGSGWDKLGTWDVMIFDESHRLASMAPGSKRNTQMGRGTMKARRHAKAAFALTGTAIMNRPDDLFGQLHFLFPDTYKAKYRDFSDRFLDYVETEHGQVCIGFIPEKLQELRDELGVFMVYRTKDDELDLPKRIFEDKLVALGPAQRAAYDDLVRQWWTQLESGETIKATNAISMLTKLRQVATGLDLVSGQVADSAKLDFTEALILDDDPDNAYLVFSWYKAPLHTLRDRLEARGIECLLVDGDVKPDDRTPIIEAFQAGKGRVFLGTISTMGESHDLYRANRMVMLDRAWNPAKNDQTHDRFYRIGQTRRTVVTNVIAEDTVDQLRVQPVLASKEAIRRSVFGGEQRVAA